MKNEYKLWIEKVKNLVAQGNTGKGIELFLEKTETSKELDYFRKQVLLISSRYQKFKKNQRIGITQPNDNTIEIVNSNLLELLVELDKIKCETYHQVKKIPGDYATNKLQEEAVSLFEWQINVNKNKDISPHFEFEKRVQFRAGCLKAIVIILIVITFISYCIYLSITEN